MRPLGELVVLHVHLPVHVHAVRVDLTRRAIEHHATELDGQPVQARGLAPDKKAVQGAQLNCRGRIHGAGG